MIIYYISFPRNKKDCNSNCLYISNCYNFRECLNCFDCACMDSSTWSWIKQTYDNVDFSCRDRKAINSDLIAVDCLSNYDFILYIIEKQTFKPMSLMYWDAQTVMPSSICVAYGFKSNCSAC